MYTALRPTTERPAPGDQPAHRAPVSVRRGRGGQAPPGQRGRRQRREVRRNRYDTDSRGPACVTYFFDTLATCIAPVVLAIPSALPATTQPARKRHALLLATHSDPKTPTTAGRREKHHPGRRNFGLEVLASERDPHRAEAFSEADYRGALSVLEGFYNLVLTDCGTGLTHSAMRGDW